jgi:hypothetical protein
LAELATISTCFVNNNDMKKPQEDVPEELIKEGLSEGNRFKELSKFKTK